MLKKPLFKPPALAGMAGRVVSSLNMEHKQQTESNASEIREGRLCAPVTWHANNLHSTESKQERKQLRRRTGVYV